MNTAAGRIADWLVRGGSISREDREVYEFGLNKLLSTVVNFLFTMCLGLLLGVPATALIFFAAYFSVRVYAGGYHADTPLRCFFISIGIMIPMLLLIRYQQLWCSTAIFYVLLGLGIAVLVWLAPVENKNKLPDDLEKIVYRRRLLRNTAIISVAAVALFLLQFREYGVAVLCGILLAAAMAVAGKIKLILQK